MSVKQISKIKIKTGLSSELPDALSEAELGFTTDSGEVFIGAPNFPRIQYRTDTSNPNNSIYPYRNIKLLTEFDLPKSIVGDYYQYGPLKRVQIPISITPTKIIDFDSGFDTIVATYSLYSISENKPIFSGNLRSTQDQIIYDNFTGVDISITYSNNQLTLYASNVTSSILILNIAGNMWLSQGITNV